MKDYNIYRTKAAADIKDVDSANRQVAVYLSKFDNIDSDNDMIKRGAFAKSIQERGVDSTSNRKIAFLRHHDWEQQIGKWLSLQEDDKGLFAVGELGRSSKGEDAWLDYQDGIIREHSIGFQYMGDKIKWMDDNSMEKGGYWMVSEVKLYEGSAVTFGANELTEVVDVIKSENRVEYADKIAKEVEALIKGLTNGKGTDERLYEMEMKLKFLNAKLLTLAKHEPLDLKHSVVSEPVKVIEAFDWNTVINKLK
jgi:HK97 family phage prohead protease